MTINSKLAQLYMPLKKNSTRFHYLYVQIKYTDFYTNVTTFELQTSNKP